MRRGKEAMPKRVRYTYGLRGKSDAREEILVEKL